MWLLSPLSWLVLAGLLLAGLLWCPALRLRARWPAGACIALGAIAVTGMTPLVANLLVARLERPARAGKECTLRPAPTIVVLAGGLDGKPRDAGDFSVLGIASRRRLERAVQYWQQADGRRLVLTGTSGDGAASDATLMAAYAGALDVPASAIRIEPWSKSTWDNARHVAGMSPKVPRRITLVTSAIHMRRATLAFEAAGYMVCPLPSDSRVTAIGFPGFLLPRSTALRKTEDALHELVGLAYYYWRNRFGTPSAAVQIGTAPTNELATE